MEPNMLKNQLSREECLSLLDRAGVGVLSLVDPEGLPYAVPVNIVRIGDRLYYHGRRTGTRVRCMENNPHCCVVVYDEKGFEDYGPDACDDTTMFESVVVRGVVSSVEDDAKKTEVLKAITAKLVPEKADAPFAANRVPATGVYEITMDEVTGKFRRPRPGSMVHPTR